MRALLFVVFNESMCGRRRAQRGRRQRKIQLKDTYRGKSLWIS